MTKFTLKMCLDTNIIRDYTVKRNKRSIFLLESFKTKKIEIVASSYCLMELSDIHKEYLFFNKCFIKEMKTVSDFISERKSKNLSKQELQENSKHIEDNIGELDFIKWLDLDEKAWPLMVDYSRTTNIDAPDIIHLTTAYLADCSHLITNDGNFKKHANNLLKERSKEEKEVIKLKVLNVEEVIKEICL